MKLPKSFWPTLFLALAAVLTVLVLVAWPLPSHAQSKYWKPTSKVGCYPAPVGRGIGLVTDVQTANGWGYYVAWWCPVGLTLAEQVGWSKSIAVTTHAAAPRFDTGMLSALLAANPADAQAVLDKVGEAARREPAGNYVAPFDALWEKGWKALDATKPADPVWAVAKNGDIADRPAYMVEAGKRTTQVIGRNAVGAPCDCKRRFLAGGWCPLKEGVDYVVALCERKP